MRCIPWHLPLPGNCNGPCFTRRLGGGPTEQLEARGRSLVLSWLVDGPILAAALLLKFAEAGDPRFPRRAGDTLHRARLVDCESRGFTASRSHSPLGRRPGSPVSGGGEIVDCPLRGCRGDAAWELARRRRAEAGDRPDPTDGKPPRRLDVGGTGGCRTPDGLGDRRPPRGHHGNRPDDAGVVVTLFVAGRRRGIPGSSGSGIGHDALQPTPGGAAPIVGRCGPLDGCRGVGSSAAAPVLHRDADAGRIAGDEICRWLCL